MSFRLEQGLNPTFTSGTFTGTVDAATLKSYTSSILGSVAHGVLTADPYRVSIGYYAGGIAPTSAYTYLMAPTNKALSIWNSGTTLVASFSDDNNSTYSCFYGNVGIGTSSPQFTLDVKTGANENLCVRSGTGIGGTSGVGIDAINDLGSAVVPLTLRASSINLNVAGGNVGIGTASPASRLSVGGAGTVLGAVAQPKISATGTGDVSIAVQGGTAGAVENVVRSILTQGQFGTTTNHNTNIISNGSPVIYATPSFNVGIGTTDFGSGTGGCIGIVNATAPSGTPVGGGVLYVEAGALKFKGSSGTVTVIAAA